MMFGESLEIHQNFGRQASYWVGELDSAVPGEGAGGEVEGGDRGQLGEGQVVQSHLVNLGVIDDDKRMSSGRGHC